MSRAIAFCTSASVFNENKILDVGIANKYPGSLWVERLSRLALQHGVEVVTGDIAIQNIQSAKWMANDVLVVQEEWAIHGDQLIEMGAIPLVLFCLESPLYASKFYAKLTEISAGFENRILFRGAFPGALKKDRDHVAYFPCFSQERAEAHSEMRSWESRKFLVMVAANKYWQIKRGLFRQLVAWGRDFLLGRKSYLTREITDHQLHDKRLELIEHFGRLGDLDLFGMYWKDIGNLPGNWKIRLAEIIRKLNPPACADKNEIISQYKFALCLENMSFPGYVTEKIIDCFAAGVVPVYLGAPDIADFVPKTAFIDLRDFDNLDDLTLYLKNVSEESALDMLQCGRDFLNSKEGQRYSFEGFSDSVMNMARKSLVIL